jgi:predicted nucleic acid-binding protein
MEITIDTSIIIAVLTNEPNKDRLIGATIRVDLIAPHSVHWEVGNAFSAMMKRNRASLEQVRAALNLYRRMPIRFVDADLAESLEIAGKLQIYAYDAYLLHCAQRFHAPLFTLDEGLRNAAARLNVAVFQADSL